MLLTRFLPKCISNLLILPVLLQYLILCASAFEFTRSLSVVGSTLSHTNQGPKDPIEYADDSLITRSGKSNKVSKLLRLIHSKAEDAVYGRKSGQSDDNKAEETQESTQTNSHLSDDEVITNACNARQSRTCKYVVRAALKTDPREKKIIANALRHKPAHVEASKLLYHKLFEYSIAKTEEKNLDEKLDLGINLLATKSPYGWVATKALDFASKTA